MKTGDVLLIAGGAFGTYLLINWLWDVTRKPLPAAPPPSPLPSPQPLPGPSPRPSLPVEVTGNPLLLVPGRRYWATVKTSGVASALASVAKIQELATQKGFSSVQVFESKPANWPGRATGGDYYLLGDFQGAQMTIDRNPGPGVEVIEAFTL